MARRFLAGGGFTSGSGTTSRPPTPFAGAQHWRSDKNFMEVYDGTNWKVFGTVVVSATADITTPYAGQMVILSSDAYRLYQYSGSAWDLYGMANTEGGEWANTAGSAQSLGAGGATKLNFPNLVVGGGDGITLSGGNTFSNDDDGLFWIDVQFRTAAAVAGGCAIGGTTYADSTLLIAPHGGLAAGPWGDVGVSAPIWLGAGTTFCAWFYNNGAATSISSATRIPRIRIWKKIAA